MCGAMRSMWGVTMAACRVMPYGGTGRIDRQQPTKPQTCQALGIQTMYLFYVSVKAMSHGR